MLSTIMRWQTVLPVTARGRCHPPVFATQRFPNRLTGIAAGTASFGTQDFLEPNDRYKTPWMRSYPARFADQTQQTIAHGSS
jgi:hypothetical protein